MNRNTESHFSELPQVDIQRSIFDISKEHLTSFNVGELVPFYLSEVLPGDTFNVTTSAVVRLQTPLTPIMSNLYLDTYYFYVPSRILWTHFKEMMGENTSSAWLPSVSYTTPVTAPPSGGWNPGTIADHLGIPPLVNNSSVIGAKLPSSLPFRAYAMICNEWFRDQNLTDPINITLGDSSITGSNGTNYITDTEKGGQLFKVAKFHDYLTSCLPAPQKGAPVPIFGNEFNQTLPSGNRSALLPVAPYSSQSVPDTYDYPLYAHTNNITSKRVSTSSTPNNNPVIFGNYQNDGFVPDNLWADVGPLNISVNDLRVAFQIQKFLEKNARAGTRMRETIREHFGVLTSDARMMIPEYLGGHRIPLSIHQVANTSEGTNSYVGDLGAMSNTSDVHEDFIKSFDEWGYVIGVCCVRYDHVYAQALDRLWFRKDRLDYYWPVFANVGEQPVFKSEVKYDSTQTGYEVFGYQEPWAEYRYGRNTCSGEMRPGVPNSLATWHLADYYTAVPTLSDGWIREDTNTVDRVLTVAHSNANQVFTDFYIKNIATRPMPMYSIPGLIDHH